MSFEFLSLPVWIMLCVFCSAFMIYTGIKRYKIDRKGLIITYFTIALLGLIAALYKLIDKVVIQYRQFSGQILNIMMGILIIVILEIIYLAITTKGNERSRRFIKIAFFLALFSIGPLVIWIVIDLFLQNRL